MVKEGISVYSTKAKDILLRPSGEIIFTQEGGPILFIENVLKESGVPFQAISGDTVDVEILITDKGEFGKVPNPPKALVLPFSDSSDWMIVSTLLTDWDFTNIDGFNGKVFVDIQGFVRDGKDFGKKRVWEESKKFAKNIFCLKGTKQEISYLPPEVLEDQKNRLLIATDGENGLTIYFQGREAYFPVKNVVHPKDTIGAGDTFFANYVVGMYKGKSPLEAAVYAMDKTSEFLSNKI